MSSSFPELMDGTREAERFDGVHDHIDERDVRWRGRDALSTGHNSSAPLAQLFVRGTSSSEADG
eukprot:1963340-Pyramimonas_sp.AAC.1